MKRIKQFFHFQPFSRKQRKVLNWWTETSPVKDYDGIIADGAIRSGKTVSMSLSFVLWAMAEGIIYDMFEKEKHVRNIQAIRPKLIDGNRYVSCDYGTQNATVFLLWNKGVDGVWYCIREYYYSGRDHGKQKTDSEYADDLEQWLDGTKIKAIIVDPAAASFIAELRKRGYRVLKAKNDVEDGIRLVSTMLNLLRIIFADSCENTIMEFGSYIWDAKAAEYGEDRPVKQHDHAMDAVRYFVFTMLGNRMAKIGSKAKTGIY